MKLGVTLSGQVHPWEELLELVEQAEALGYDTAFVDGDTSMLDVRRESDVLDGWTLTTALLARTTRIRIGSIRLVHHWNAARLAQALASLERIAPGRLQVLIAAGDRPADRRFGLPLDPPGRRVERVEETLRAVRALLRGETVHQHGAFVRLEGARVRPTPPAGALPIAVAARRPRMLEVVAAHADLWEINLPPVAGRVQEASRQLEQACRRRGRAPGEIRRSMWIFTRVDAEPAQALAEQRRLQPWFRAIPDDEILSSLVTGDAADCRAQIAAHASSLALDLPVVDLSYLDAARARTHLEALAPDKGLT